MKFDMHVHTNYSPDSVAEARAIVRAAKKVGLEGIAITDHNTCKGWKEMGRQAKKVGVSLIFGEEVAILKDGEKVGEALTYFIDEEVKAGSLGEIIDSTREQAGIVSIAHPFDRFKSNLDEMGPVRKVDAIEVYNARVLFQSMNKKAMEFAKKYELGMTAGSDAHTSWEVGDAYAQAKVNSLEEFKKAIIKRKTSVHGKKINPFLRIFPTLARLKIIR